MTGSTRGGLPSTPLRAPAPAIRSPRWPPGTTSARRRTARTTVSEWCETWLAGYATRRPSTVRQARVHVAQITAEFGAMPLAAVRPSHVRSWTSRLRDENLSVSYVYALHSRLAQIMAD